MITGHEDYNTGITVKEFVLVEGFPLPPSVNRSLVHRQGRFRSTGVMRDYKTQCQEFFAYYNLKRQEACELLNEWLSRGYFIEINCSIYTERENIIFKNGKIKPWDHSNRIKATHDQIAVGLGVDDRYFKRESSHLVIGKDRTDVILSPILIPFL